MSLTHTHSLSHTKWDCKYYVVFVLKYRRKKYFMEVKDQKQNNTNIAMQLERSKYRGEQFWCRRYYVDIAGKNDKAIQEYIKNQLKEDELSG